VVGACQLDHSSRWLRRPIPRLWLRFAKSVAVAVLGFGRIFSLPSGYCKLHAADSRFPSLRSAEIVHKFIACFGLLLSWLRFAKWVSFVSQEMSRSVCQWLRTYIFAAYSVLPTHSRPTFAEVGSFGQIFVRSLNGASGTQREHSNKALSLRCKVPRSLLHA
jgi:hypothetical protein